VSKYGTVASLSVGRDAFGRGVAAGLLVLAVGCGQRESADVARDRAAERFLHTQLSDTKRLLARLESGELVTRDRIAIGITEGVVKQLLDASLPPEMVLGNHVRLRIESAQPIFRGSNAALLFQAVARGVKFEDLTARVELAGTLARFRLDDTKLRADVELAHFKVLETSLGAAPAGLLEALIEDNLKGLNDAIPGIEIPVHLEHSIEIGGLDEGVVQARAGALPLEITVAEVIPGGERLWVLLDAKAGPWQPRGSAPPRPAPTAPPTGSPRPGVSPAATPTPKPATSPASKPAVSPAPKTGPSGTPEVKP
jgi:hypothetical protein